MNDLGHGPPQIRSTRLASVRRRYALTAVVSVAWHLMVLMALVYGRTETPPPPEPEPMVVALVDLKPMADPVKPDDPPRPKPVKPPPPRPIFRQTPLPPPPDVVPLQAGDGPSADGDDEMSDAQVASAETAGSGGAGRACNMVRLLQTALRKDPLVRNAVAGAHRGKALNVWNGDWVRHRGQEGNGLAAVREVIMWEVGFAPEACRAEPVRGLVMISLDDSPGAARVVLGSDRWRWTDLLFARGAVSP
ncbi:MAG: hypothetical protein Q8M88_00250 [Phenylobacterium sp.]|uniref:hypothetical protein n=1 Tax=Phenylobacterium sp. TaxID=1871053 RepID=UPI002735B4C7|nr:hypothetical protein [Phenylobacterium sp.]MDP3172849.1 hypothetical protein [Phenylobacterium sp.]